MRDITSDDFLNALREFQSSSRRSPYGSFEDYYADKIFGKTGGHYNPGFGMMGPPGNTSSFAPTGPRNRPSGNQLVGFGGSHGLPQKPSRQPYDKPYSTEPWFGNQQFGVEAGVRGTQPSKYNNDRPNQPPPWIDDVNMSSIWYSPMEPVWPFGPPYYTRPREWNYPVGYNLNYVPQRLELMGMLRGMRRSWGVLATVIETRKDQILRIPYTIKKRQGASSVGIDAAIKEAKKFLQRPDGKLSYGQWSRKLLDDVLVIDSPAIFMDRDLGGKLIAADVLDGGTIFPLIDDAGRRPDTTAVITEDGISYEHRQPAFQQIIYGLPMVNLSEDELLYPIMRPLPEMPVFGYSPVEQILVEATEAIRKTFYQLEFWRAGSLPELIVTVPENWSPRQIAMFQAHFDALLSGQLALKSKVRFLPGNMKPFEIKNASGENLWSQRDETLIRLVCYAYSVSPTPFVKQLSRGTAQNASQTSQEEGLYPLMAYWKDDIMGQILQQLGLEDIEFVFLPRPEVDLLKQAQIHQLKLHDGQMTINEARVESGQEPYSNNLGDTPLIYAGNSIVPVEAAIAGEAISGGAGGETEENSGQGNKIPGRGAPSKPRQDSAHPKTSMQKTVSQADLRDAAAEADRHATFNQKKSGNYRKGHVHLHGMNITIENAKGSKRGEKDKYGRGFKVKMPAAYGYIRGTVGADEQQVDVYLGKHPDERAVYVIDQDKFDDGKDKGFDEHKVMLGYRKAKRAVKDYLKSHFDGLGHERLRAITALSVADFKHWLANGDMKRPISEQGVGTVIARRGINGGIEKADTISSGTNLLSYDQTTALPKKRKKKKKNKMGPRWLELVA